VFSTHYYFRFTLLAFLSIVLISSCGYRNKNILFKTDKKIRTKEAIYVHYMDSVKRTAEIYKHRIKVGDRLEIRFINNYDIGQAAGQSGTSTANMQGTAYLVNYDSTVTLPLVGRTNLIGLTRLEAAKYLEDAYGKFVINPLIEVNITSLSVTVLGEVTIQGKILLDKEKTTLVDVIALSGGFRETGKKKDIRIIRKGEVIVVNLKTVNALNNTKIDIQDGDIIYVEPYGVRAQTEMLTSLQSSINLLVIISQISILTIQILNFTRSN
jgi:polysaccharide export outer membrane protein